MLRTASLKVLQEEKGRRTGLSATVPSDKGSLPGELTSQLFLVAWCPMPLWQQQRGQSITSGKVPLAHAHMKLWTQWGRAEPLQN